MALLSSDTFHATTVAVGGRGVMIEGASGSGKSDLALRLIDRGAQLVSDDYTFVRRQDGALLASAPDRIAGKIEVRGVGIVDMPQAGETAVALLVTLDDAPMRLPEPADIRTMLGVALPMLALSAFEASTPIKVELAAARAGVVR